MPTFIQADLFASFLRYLIKAAQDKRVVPYHEVENVFGLSHNMAGAYAGAVGDFCREQEWPMLNSLIINTTSCRPSDGFDSYLPEEMQWGDCLSECWKSFHLATSRQHQVKNFSGITQQARTWVQERSAS